MPIQRLMVRAGGYGGAMCIFTGVIEVVTSTQIFARRDGAGRQMLAYSMQLAAGADVAMVLPLPVPPGASEEAVDFIDLSTCPHFFADMQKAFAPPRGYGPPMAAGAPQAMLQVHDVGDFEASFVPTPADFGRLDPRFRLSDDVWSALPGYADWGFAVFKLRATQQKTIHPMAFSFPTRHPAKLYFPTVHVHDGVVHQSAHFDHVLYCQLSAHSRDVVKNEARRLAAQQKLVAEGGVPQPSDDMTSWVRSDHALMSTMTPYQTWGVIDGWEPAYRTMLHGDLPNHDVWIRF
jgi:hypothetical protein